MSDERGEEKESRGAIEGRGGKRRYGMEEEEERTKTSGRMDGFGGVCGLAGITLDWQDGQDRTGGRPGGGFVMVASSWEVLGGGFLSGGDGNNRWLVEFLSVFDQSGSNHSYQQGGTKGPTSSSPS